MPSGGSGLVKMAMSCLLTSDIRNLLLWFHSTFHVSGHCWLHTGPLLEIEVLTGLNLRPSILRFPFVLGYRNNTPQVQRNHRDFLLEDKVKVRCCISSTGRLPLSSSASWEVLWFYRETPLSSIPWPLCNPWTELCEQQSKFIYFMNNRTIITHDGADWRLLLCVPLARCPWSKIGCKSLHNWLYFGHSVSTEYDPTTVPICSFLQTLGHCQWLGHFLCYWQRQQLFMQSCLFLCKEVW